MQSETMTVEEMEMRLADLLPHEELDGEREAEIRDMVAGLVREYQWMRRCFHKALKHVD